VSYLHGHRVNCAGACTHKLREATSEPAQNHVCSLRGIESVVEAAGGVSRRSHQTATGNEPNSSTIPPQNFTAVPANHVLSVVPTKNPFGWSGLMPNLFFHQRYPPKIAQR
jgi:hypothetical protein